MKQRSLFIGVSTICFYSFFMAASLSAHAFDPTEGNNSAATRGALPSTNLLVTAPKNRAPSVQFPGLSQTSGNVALAPIAAQPANDLPGAAASEEQAASSGIAFPRMPAGTAVTPVPTDAAEAPTRPLAPITLTPPAAKPAPVAPTPVIATAPQLTPRAVEAPKAVAMPASVAQSAPSFIAPVPLLTTPAPPIPAPAPVAVAKPVAPAPMPVPVVVGKPVTPAPVVPVAVAAPVQLPKAEGLTTETKTILSSVPSQIDSPKPSKAETVALQRVNPAAEAIKGKEDKADVYEASGIKISVRRPGLDTNYELNRAYNALASGDTQTAIETYKAVLSTEPQNADALFGLASLYHRQGDIAKARPLYGVLLKNYPNHREGLNNFLVLVGDESPQEALAELERLEQRNPNFSPIPMQQALLLNKLGFVVEARNKMLRAIELAPDNLTYKYNLAIMLDRQGNYDEAANLYRLLISAVQRGGVVPASLETMQKRLNYIATISTERKGAMMQENTGNTGR